MTKRQKETSAFILKPRFLEIPGQGAATLRNSSHVRASVRLDRFSARLNIDLIDERLDLDLLWPPWLYCSTGARDRTIVIYINDKYNRVLRLDLERVSVSLPIPYLHILTLDLFLTAPFSSRSAVFILDETLGSHNFQNYANRANQH